MIVRRAIKNDAVVAGGGAIEMELSKYLRDYSRSIAGKEQLLIGVMARALEIIPRQLCDNAGFDATNILNKLRQKHFQGKDLSLFSLVNFRCCLILNVGKCTLGKVNLEPTCLPNKYACGMAAGVCFAGLVPAHRVPMESSLLCLILVRDPHQPFLAPVPKLIYWRWV